MKKGTPKRGRYGDGCIYRRKKNTGPWWITWHEPEVQPDGTTKRVKRYESTKSEDKKFAQRVLRSKLQEVGGRRPTVVDPKKVSFDDLRDNFLQHCVMKGIRSLKRKKDGTPTLATLPRLEKAFGTWKASEITVADLKRFRSEARAQGLSDARVNRYMATARAMFRQAVKDELITRTEMPSYFPVVAEPNEARGAIYIKDEWYKPLREHLKEPLRSAFTLAYRRGIRVHEIQRIHWRDIDMEKRIINLPGEITKTGRQRSVSLPNDFDRKPEKPDDLVFPLGKYRWQWYKAAIAVGAGRWEEAASGRKRYVGILLRHTRHSALRNMSDSGLEEKRIMDISGHVTRATFDRYNIGREEDVARSGKIIDRFHEKKQRKL